MDNKRPRRPFSPWSHSMRTLTLIAWLCVWPQRTAAQGPGAGVVTAEVGETVTLTAPVTADILTFAWYRGTAVTEPQLILSYIVSSSAQKTGPQFTGRESGRPDGSLRITDLRTNDTGDYTVTMTLNSAITTRGSQQLRVYDLPPNPPNKGLTDGAIAGIVIAVLVVVAGVAALVYVFVFKKPASGAAAARNSTEMASNNKEGAASPKANGTPAEIEYSSVNFVPKRGTPAKPTSPENTVYSEVKRQ